MISDDIFCRGNSVADLYKAVDSVEQNNKYSYKIVTINYDVLIEKSVDFLNRFFKAGINVPLAKLHGSADGGIVPPTWQKSINPSLKKSWQDAAKWLSEANEIRILGYSLSINDVHIKHLLSTSLLESTNLQRVDAICLDPHGNVEKRFRSLFTYPRFEFYSKDLKSYLDAFLTVGYTHEPFKTNIKDPEHYHAPYFP